MSEPSRKRTARAIVGGLVDARAVERLLQQQLVRRRELLPGREARVDSMRALLREEALKTLAKHHHVRPKLFAFFGLFLARPRRRLMGLFGYVLRSPFRLLITMLPSDTSGGSSGGAAAAPASWQERLP